MRHIFCALLSLGLTFAAVRGNDRENACGSFGTSVDFVNSPSEAAPLAKKQQKLVFVLHVSGHFEDPRFT